MWILSNICLINTESNDSRICEMVANPTNSNENMNTTSWGSKQLSAHYYRPTQPKEGSFESKHGQPIPPKEQTRQ